MVKLNYIYDIIADAFQRIYNLLTTPITRCPSCRSHEVHYQAVEIELHTEITKDYCLGSENLYCMDCATEFDIYGEVM